MMDPGRQAQIVGDLAVLIEEFQAAYACNEVEAFMLLLEKASEAVIAMIPNADAGSAALADITRRMQITVTHGDVAPVEQTLDEIKRGE